jgi:FkbM family methyltransferase
MQSPAYFLRARLKRYPRVVWWVRQLRVARAVAEEPTRAAAGFFLSGNKQMLDGTFEPDETRWLSGALRTADVFVDIGANIGYYTCLAKAAGVHVVAIEPLSRNLTVLCKNLSANAWHDVEVFPVGVGQTSRIVELYGDTTGASLVPGWAGAPVHNTELIALSTLDVLVGARFAGKRVVVKIDIEGAELDALRGATMLLANDPAPEWLVEIMFREHHPLGANPHFLEAFELMWSHGYSAFTADGRFRPIEPGDVARWLTNGRLDFGGHNYIFSKARGR